MRIIVQKMIMALLVMLVLRSGREGLQTVGTGAADRPRRVMIVRKFLSMDCTFFLVLVLAEEC